MDNQVVFFDLGSTLIYSKEAWKDYFTGADEVLLQVLNKTGISITKSLLTGDYPSLIDRYIAEYTPKDTSEITTLTALGEIIRKSGKKIPDASILTDALKAFYQITNRNWLPEKEAIPTLHQLTNAGYRLGIISNTSDDTHVQDLVDIHGFRPYFDHVITSAGFGIRKPDPRIFQYSLDQFHISPHQAVMVGDTLDADILGSNQMGVFSIWITRRAIHQESKVVADKTIQSLDEIPAILRTLRENGGSNSH